MKLAQTNLQSSRRDSLKIARRFNAGIGSVCASSSAGMPADPRGDALHLALASVAKCDMLLSWNCRHIVNPRKAEHIESLNTKMHLHIPRLFTPFELLKMESKNED